MINPLHIRAKSATQILTFVFLIIWTTLPLYAQLTENFEDGEKASYAGANVGFSFWDMVF